MAKSIGIDEEALRQIEAAAEARGVSASDLLMQLIAPAMRTPDATASNGPRLRETWTTPDTPGSTAHRQDLKHWLVDWATPGCWPCYWSWPRD